MTTFTVTTLADPSDTSGLAPGDLTLRGAVAAAGNGDTIVFAPGLQGQTIVLGSTLVLEKGITIDGGAGVTLSDGSPNPGDGFTILQVEGSAAHQIRLENLTIADGSGRGSDGANNYSSQPKGAGGSGGDAAGGIYVHTGAVDLAHVTFVNDYAVGGAGGSSFGNGGAGGTAAGAVYVESGATLTGHDLTFNGNNANGGNGGNSFSETTGSGGEAAGTIYAEHDATVTLTGAYSASGNSASGGQNPYQVQGRSYQDSNLADHTNPMPCYVTGTLILTARGEVPVEALSVGDLVVTASGAHRPIRWIGHRLTDIASHPEPLKVMPVRIEAGAVAPGVPVRDLRVSPDHAIALDGALVKAGRLVNGAGIIRESVPSVTYWHVELDSHDLLVAEGLAAESYIESDNRHAFENGGAVMALHPDFKAAGDYASRTCLPLVEGGDALKAIRAKLFARTPERFTTEAQVMLLADGIALAPVSTDGRHHRFAVPEGVRSLRLVSRSGIASEVQGESGDHRRFGVMVRGLHIDGTAVSFDALGEGWNAQAPGRDHRWTDGDAVLPLGRAVSFVAAPLERYPADASVEARRAA